MDITALTFGDYLDGFAITISLFALFIGWQTRKKADQWRYEVEGRQPFLAELQGFQAVNNKVLFCSIELRTLIHKMQTLLDKAEEKHGPQENINNFFEVLKKFSEDAESLKSDFDRHQETLKSLWDTEKPTPEHLSIVQKMRANVSTVLEVGEKNCELIELALVEYKEVYFGSS